MAWTAAARRSGNPCSICRNPDVEPTFSAIIVNVSATGARLRGCGDVSQGDDLWIKVGVIDALATAVWAEDGQCGVTSTPLSATQIRQSPEGGEEYARGAPDASGKAGGTRMDRRAGPLGPDFAIPPRTRHGSSDRRTAKLEFPWCAW